MALVAALVLLLARAHADTARDSARDAALQAARREALNLTTISYLTASRDLERVLAGATGQLRTQFASERAQFPEVLSREKSVSRGTVVASGLVSLSTSAGTARVLIAVDGAVSTSAGGSSQPVVKHYRMVMRLRRQHGRWLVSDVAFAGVPR